MSSRANSSELAHVVDELGDWTSGPGPLYRRLAAALARAVERGVLADGSRLPAERVLARALSISRGTSVATYDSLLGEGLLERRRGSGTYVRSPTAPLPEGREGTALVGTLVERSAGRTEVVDLSLSVLADAEALPEVTLSASELRGVVPATGYTPFGLASLRRAIAEHVSGWGLPTAPIQIVVTTGAQQAVVAAAACWVRPGDTVVVEDPTYPGAIAAFRQAGARLLPLAVDSSGMRPEALGRALEQRPALVYVQSGPHSPTGSILAGRRRLQIAQLVSGRHVPLLEDAALVDLAWERVPPPIASYAPDATVALAGSLDKLFWGGLRVGFIRAPEPLAQRLARVKATHDLGSSVPAQVLAQRLLGHRQRARYVRGLRARLKSRYGELALGLAAAIPGATWPVPRGGLSLWVRLPRADGERFAELALRHGVSVAPPSTISLGGQFADRIRVSFAPAPDVLREGTRRLGAAWREYPR